MLDNLILLRLYILFDCINTIMSTYTDIPKIQFIFIIIKQES